MPVRKIGHLLWERPCISPPHDADTHIICTQLFMADKSGECFLIMHHLNDLYQGSAKWRRKMRRKAAGYLRPRVSQNRPVELGFCSVNLIKS